MGLQFITSIKAVRSKSLVAFQQSGNYALPTLSGNMPWTELQFTPGKTTFSETPSNSAPGTLYQSTLQFAGTDDSPEKHQLITGLEPYELIVLIGYNTGRHKVLGSPSFPARLIVEQSTENNSVFLFKITCSSIYRTPFLKI